MQLYICGLHLLSLLEEEEYFSGVQQLKGSIPQISQWVKVQHEHLSKYKNKCQCVWIDCVRIFNSPDLFTEKLLDIYGRGKKFPKDLVKVLSNIWNLVSNNYLWPDFKNTYKENFKWLRSRIRHISFEFLINNSCLPQFSSSHHSKIK